MKISDITPRSLGKVNDGEVISIHFRIHELWGVNFEGNTNESSGGMTREDLINAHAFIIEEMSKRKMNHNNDDKIDNIKSNGDVVLVPNFVNVVGSSVHKEDAPDLDVLIRAEIRDEHFIIQPEAIFLPIRKVLDPDKKGHLHFIGNPQGPHADFKPVYDLVLRACPGEIQTIKAIKPGIHYRVMKPSMSGTTDAFDVSELWDWSSKKINKGHGLLASPKVDGFRSIISYDGNNINVSFEDSENKHQFNDIKINGPSFVIEGEFTATIDGKWVSRSQLAGIASGKQKAEPFFWLYDLLYYNGKDMSTEPFENRLAILKKVNLPEGSFFVLEQREIKNEDDLSSCLRWALTKDLAEGLFLRQSDAPYYFGSTDTAAKIKTVCELKVEVVEVIKKKNGETYHCGLREPGDFTNIVGDLLDLGNTFVGDSQNVEKGQTLNVVIEELVAGYNSDGKKILYWGKPTVRGPDKSRPSYTVDQTINMAKRRGIFKEEISSKALQEQDTRSAIADQNWQDHWHECWPENGTGKFVVQHHYRGLSEEESTLDEDALLKTNNSIHGDLRFSFGSALDGFTMFYGTTDNVVKAGGDRLSSLPPDDAMQGAWKLNQPLAWLQVGTPSPYLVKPGGLGSTSQGYAKFFAYDHGTWHPGVWRAHSFEIFLSGSKINGRFIIAFAPLGGSRKWIIIRPEDQTPYAEKHLIDDVIKELHNKGQSFLLWSKPGSKPELINIKNSAPEKG